MSKKKKPPMQSYKHHCRICNKGFGCGRALGGHMRAHGVSADECSAAATDPGDTAEEDDPATNPRQNDDGDENLVDWATGKRSDRGKSAAGSQDEDLAHWLVMLSAGRVEPSAAALVDTEESCASAGKEERTASFLPVEKPKGLFECKACKKVFTSHQALGGHRASHKKVKGCFAAKMEEEEGQAEEEAVVSAAALGRKKKLHECSVCHRVFTSGQALGGHKRCHWLTSNGGEQRGEAAPLLQLRPMSERLDLNLPAPAEEGGAAGALRVNVPAMLLQAWMETEKMEAAGAGRGVRKRVSPSRAEDEAESSVKLAKLSDLKDMNAGGASNSWLQVGLGSPSKHSRKS